jgi:hypothetical protein
MNSFNGCLGAVQTHEGWPHRHRCSGIPTTQPTTSSIVRRFRCGRRAHRGPRRWLCKLGAARGVAHSHAEPKQHSARDGICLLRARAHAGRGVPACSGGVVLRAFRARLLRSACAVRCRARAVVWAARGAGARLALRAVRRRACARCL